MVAAFPSDLLVEQLERDDLTINLGTARIFGVELPPTLFACPDDVIE
jgi:hypothetical protein